MKTSAQIQMDFAQARKRADEIDEIAANLRTLARRDLGDTVQELSSAWRGDNARMYLSKASRLQEDIAKTSGELQNIAGNIRTVARKLYEAEMEALRIATQRSVGDGGGSGGGGGGGGGGAF